MNQNSTHLLCGNGASSAITLSQSDIPEFGKNTAWSVKKSTMSSGVSAGIELIEVNNGLQTVSILATRGMGLWKIEREGCRFGWDSPVLQPVHPAYINLKSRNNLGWVEGFNELLCRCGLSFNGPPGIDDGAASPLESDVTLHGQIANLPAESVEIEFETNAESETIVIRGIVREASLFGPNLELQAEYRISLGCDEIQICDTVLNRASRPAELELLYHINVGQPVLESGASWKAPIQSLAPKDARAAEDIATPFTYLPPTVGYAEQVYFCKLNGDSQKRSAAMVKSSSGNSGFGIEFDLQSLPYFTIWKNTQATEDGYCTGLEPSTSYPNFKAFERTQGRVVNIGAGESWQTVLKLKTLADNKSVEAFSQKIDAIQGDSQPVIHNAPQSGLQPE
ncbi:MAG: aldose 1-epimerase family protein [Planctomycetaceae bacterium]|nr:aldose 1-epimerase family protein [Planctomycetaceae bacterium]